MSELNLILSNPSILSKIILSSIYSRIVLKTLVTSILLLSITKYLSLDPSIFSTPPNKLLTLKHKGLTLFVLYSSLYFIYYVSYVINIYSNSRFSFSYFKILYIKIINKYYIILIIIRLVFYF